MKPAPPATSATLSFPFLTGGSLICLFFFNDIYLAQPHCTDLLHAGNGRRPESCRRLQPRRGHRVGGFEQVEFQLCRAVLPLVPPEHPPARRPAHGGGRRFIEGP